MANFPEGVQENNLDTFDDHGHLGGQFSAVLERADMTPADLIRHIQNHGGQIAIAGSELALTAPQPIPAVLLRQLRSYKAEWVRHLNVEAANSDPAERRQLEVLEMLAREPGITYAFISDDAVEEDAVIVTLAIRGKSTCKLRIPKQRYKNGKDHPYAHPPNQSLEMR